jgi:glycosyltransferase involved in cell wall biosynthesis
MNIVHLTASRFFGGPERQMLGLAEALPEGYSTVFLSFSESGCCREFLSKAEEAGFNAIALKHDTPHLLAARRELTKLLRRLRADFLLCHGYKADLIGRLAGRKLGIPVVAVSRGWTGECLKVRLYEALDRPILRRMDKVVCVSAAQAEKVRRAGVREEKITVIHNAIYPDRFATPDPAYRERLLAFFGKEDRERGTDAGTGGRGDAESRAPMLIVGAAGRLSPEKGFSLLIDAAALVLNPPVSASPRLRGPASSSSPLTSPHIGFILFGDGPLRDALARQIAARGLEGRFLLAGFRPDLDRFLPHLDLFVQSSFTEGLPNVILEAQAARVPVVATSVGGTPEVIEDGQTGWLVPPGDAAALAERVASVLSEAPARAMRCAAGHARVEDWFSFSAQARRYAQLFEQLVGHSHAVDAGTISQSVAQSLIPNS